MKARKVKALLGIIIILSALIILGGYSLISLALEGYIGEKPRSWFGSTAYIVILVLLVLGFLTGTYEIKQTSILARSIFGKHDLPFKDITEIRILPWYSNTLFFGMYC